MEDCRMKLFAMRSGLAVPTVLTPALSQGQREIDVGWHGVAVLRVAM